MNSERAQQYAGWVSMALWMLFKRIDLPQWYATQALTVQARGNIQGAEWEHS
jgi:hypothetical protein